MTYNDIAKYVDKSIDAEDVLYMRTAFPFKAISAKEFYKACQREVRINKNGIRLCDFCNSIATKNDLCEKHWRVLYEER